MKILPLNWIDALIASGRVGLVLAVFYAALCLAAYLIQNHVVFPGTSLQPRADAPPPNAQEVWINTNGGERVVGWYFRGHDTSARSPGPAVMMFHGNYELIDNRVDMAHLYTHGGVSLLLVEYRGFGLSEGRPSESGILADSHQFYDWLTEQPAVDAKRIVVHGISIGGGPAANLATTRPVAAMILESTFTSAPEMFRRHALPGFVSRYRFGVEQTLQGFSGPVLILHGTNDPIIPIDHARRLHKAAAKSTLRTFDQGHDLLPFDTGYTSAIGNLLNQVGRATVQ